MTMAAAHHIAQRDRLRLALSTRDVDQIDAAIAAGGAIRLEPADVDRHRIVSDSHGGASYLATSTAVPAETRLAAWCALLDAHFAYWPDQADPPPPPRPPVPADLQERFAAVVDHLAGRYLSQSLRILALASADEVPDPIAYTRPTSPLPEPAWDPEF